MSAALDRNLTSRIGTRAALAGGVLCLLCLVATAVAVRSLPALQLRDVVVLDDFTSLATPHAAPWENALASLADTAPATLIGIALAAIALLRRRARLALLVGVICIGASASTELTKAMLSMPHHSPLLAPGEMSAHSWPSGHSTAMMALMLCLVVVAPRRWRLLAAACGACLTLGVSFSLLALRWHFPSDVIGGYLMAGTWTCFGVAALRALDDRLPAGARCGLSAGSARHAVGARDAGRLRPALIHLSGALGRLGNAGGWIAIAAVAVMASIALAAEASQALAFAAAHPLMIATACLIAALAIGLSSTLALALRR